MNPKKICVIHLNQIGDLAFAMPLLKALRENFPRATIHAVVKPYLRELLTDSPYVDDILVRSDTLWGKMRFLRNLWKTQYDLTICLPRSEESVMMAFFSRGRTKVGFASFLGTRVLDMVEPVDGHPLLAQQRQITSSSGLDGFSERLSRFFPH